MTRCCTLRLLALTLCAAGCASNGGTSGGSSGGSDSTSGSTVSSSSSATTSGSHGSGGSSGSNCTSSATSPCGPVASRAEIVFENGVVENGAQVQELFTMDLDGGDLTQLTNDGANKFLPHFSPDGTRLVYSKFPDGGYGQAGARSEVAVYDFGTHTESVLTHDGHGFQPVWSPDGTQIAYDTFGSSLHVMDADGSNDHTIGQVTPATAPDGYGDIAWSSDGWILFAAPDYGPDGGCFKVRLDKVRPDGGQRTPVTRGGIDCTPPGYEQSGDADPGFSPDGQIVYSSRGFPVLPQGASSAILPSVERKLYAFSSDAWTPGKVERDLSLPSEPSCIEGVPKASPDGTRVLLFRTCFDSGAASRGGIYVTDTAGSYRAFVTEGFGPDWNPAWRP